MYNMSCVSLFDKSDECVNFFLVEDFRIFFSLNAYHAIHTHKKDNDEL